MRKFKLFVLLLGIFSFFGLLNVKAAPESFQVVVDYYVDGTKVTSNSPTSYNLGAIVNHNAQHGTAGQYDFHYWLVNGRVRTDLPQNLSLKVSTDLTLHAHFVTAGVKAAVLMDTNLNHINTIYGNAIMLPATISNDKPLSEFKGWAAINDYETILSGEYTLLSPVTFFVAKYEVATAEVAGSLTIDDVVQSQKAVNEVVAPTAPTGFSHWTDGEGNILSYNPNYKFSMLKENRVLKSILVTQTPEPLVNMFVEPNLRTGHLSVVGQFENNAGYTVLGYGFIISRSLDNITFDSPGITVIPSSTFNEETNEFLRSFKDDSYNTIRAYAIFDNGVAKVTKYSATIVGGEQPLYATDLFISEYIEGSSNNKAIEIYNGTGSPVDLSNYRLELYTNGATSPSNTEVLAGTLAHGDVYIVANSSANAEILALANITSTVTYFNGDDAIALVKIDSEEKIDVFGVIGEDPGTHWTVGSGSTLDYTLVRKLTVSSPTTPWNTAEWDVYPKDTITYLGNHIRVSGVSHEIEYNDGGVKTIEFVKDGNLITYEPTKVGYTFDGWYLDSGLLTPFNTANPVNQSLKLYAKWTAIPTYTVTFNSNGGSAVESQTVYEGETATEPTPPTRSGYTFEGWYDSTLTTAYIFSTPVIADITLYAKWTAVATHTVTFNSNGGSAVTPQTVNDGALATEPTPEPTKSGYLFGGWYSDIGLTTAYNFNTPVTADITLYAKWCTPISATLSGAEMSTSLGATANTTLNDGTSYTGTPSFDYATGLGLDTSIFDVTFAKNNANAWAANTGVLRGYYNASGGGSIKIDIASGYVIKEIKINLKGANATGTNSLLVNDVAYTFNISNKTTGTASVLVSSLRTNSVTVQCNHTNRMYIESIEITYISNP